METHSSPHPFLAVLSSPVPFPPTGLSGITSQINSWHPNPRLMICFWGNPNYGMSCLARQFHFLGALDKWLRTFDEIPGLREGFNETGTSYPPDPQVLTSTSSQPTTARGPQPAPCLGLDSLRAQNDFLHVEAVGKKKWKGQSSFCDPEK